MWVGWKLQGFCYDQLMNLGGRVLIPLSLLNLIATGAWMMRNEIINLF